MGAAYSANEAVTVVGDGLRAGLDAALRATGGVIVPSVHMLAEDRDEPLVGTVTCRPFYRGRDAAVAVTDLGLLPSVLWATRLVVAWEAQDLNAALEAPVDPDGSALVVLDAQILDGQRRTWYPLRCRLGEPGEDSVIVPEWGPPVVMEDPPLPGPVAALLELWRRWFELDLTDTAERLMAAGYRLRWFVR